MTKVFVDTGIFVSVLNEEPKYEKAATFLENVMQNKFDAFISVITISEILSVYHKISEKEAIRAKAYIETIFGKDMIVPVIKEIAEIAGKIKATHKMSLGDAVIVASSIMMGCNYLVSLDPEIRKSGIITVKEPKEIIF